MKNFIYIIILIVSSNIYAQNTIENDPLFLKYEQEYLKIGSSKNGVNYDLAIKNFYSNFIDYKDTNKFKSTKDKERWLDKNFKKTKFNSAEEAIDSYNKIINSKEIIDKAGNNIKEIRNELLKKYDTTLIWETLQNRIKANR